MILLGWIGIAVLIYIVGYAIWFVRELIRTPRMDDHGHYLDENWHVISKAESQALTHRRGKNNVDLRAVEPNCLKKGSSKWGRGA
jgi:hypothetical protein